MATAVIGAAKVVLKTVATIGAAAQGVRTMGKVLRKPSSLLDGGNDRPLDAIPKRSPEREEERRRDRMRAAGLNDYLQQLNSIAPDYVRRSGTDVLGERYNAAIDRRVDEYAKSYAIAGDTDEYDDYVSKTISIVPTRSK